MGSMLISPMVAFGLVEKGVFRSNSPGPTDFAFLRTLNLRTVVYLSPERLIKPVLKQFEENGVRFVNLGVDTWRTPVKTTISEELVKDALEMILNVANHPIMIVCTSGVHLTGAVIGCLRRLQDWNLTAILDEYRSYARSKTRYVNEQFIELFDVDLVTLPTNLPPWLLRHQQLLAEEEEDIKSLRLGQSVASAAKIHLQFLCVTGCGRLISDDHEYTNASIIDDDDDD